MKELETKQLTWDDYYKWKEDNNIPDILDEEVNEFISTADLLGYIGKTNAAWVNNKNLLSFLEEYRDAFKYASSAELLLLMENSGLSTKIKRDDEFAKLIKSPVKERDIDGYIKNINDEIGDNENEDEDNNEIIDELINGDVSVEELGEVRDDEEDVEEQLIDELPKSSTDIIEGLKIYDNKYFKDSDISGEVIKFLIENKINNLWNSFMNGEVSIDNIEDKIGGEYFRLIVDTFLSEKKIIDGIAKNIPEDYHFEFQPNLMQLLTVLRLKQKTIYGNWSTTGSGNTSAAVLARRYNELKNVVVVTFNSTKGSWEKSINSYFENQNIFDGSNYEMNTPLPENEYNYVIFNYEFFQTANAEYKLNEFLKTNRVDYLILDEVHSVKQRTIEDISIRRENMVKFIDTIREANGEKFHMLAMTATPLINNYVEAKKQLELMSRKKYDDYSTKSSSVNAGVKFHMAFTDMGMRSKVKKSMKDVQLRLNDINGNHLIEQLYNCKTDLDIELTLLYDKFEAYKKYVKKGSIIYTYYVDGITDKLKALVEELGFTVGIFTGTEKDGLELFLNKKVDVLIGSAPMGTGVDGLQNISNRMICHSLPWTYAEFEQLRGRINRQGSKFDVAEFIIPKVVVEYYDHNKNEEVKWSRDKHKINIIKYKKDVFSIVMDGNIPDSVITDINKLKKKSKENLDNIIKKLRNGELTPINREEIDKLCFSDVKWIQLNRTLGEFSTLNREWSTSNSSNLHSRIKKNPDHWKYYHKKYRESRETWSEIPYKEIAKIINRLSRTDAVIADFGCGENLLKEDVENKVLSFDHHAIDDTVISCDISNVPLREAQVDVAVLSLALMGSNSSDYIKEAYRTLKGGGYLFIAEPKAKWENRIEGLIGIINESGFDIVGDVDIREKFIYIRAAKL